VCKLFGVNADFMKILQVRFIDFVESIVSEHFPEIYKLFEVALFSFTSTQICQLAGKLI
jgi:hypothetical protein